jgi:hypothetical protein
MEPENHLLIENLIPKLQELSKQKYGSNVLEKVNEYIYLNKGDLFYFMILDNR